MTATAPDDVHGHEHLRGTTAVDVDASGLAMDDDARYRAMKARDARFDGRFFIGVRTTGIYCRPSCPTPIQPLRRNLGFYPTAASAQQAGFRACKRCRPDATPGSPEWNVRADLVGRALRLIGDGVVDREGVSGLARRLSVSDRHLNRLLSEQVGAGPIALARAQRAQTARLLIETTSLSFSDVAFAAGFSSVRQFNDTVKEVFAAPPTALRSSSSSCRGAGPLAAGGAGVVSITIRLAVRSPFDHDHLLSFLAARSVGGVESMRDGMYSRSVHLAGGPAVVDVHPSDDGVVATFHLSDLRDLASATARTRRLLDLDADPVAVAEVLAADPVLRDVVRVHPGLRSPGALDPHEAAVRAVIGQQVSVASARRTAENLTESFGRPLRQPIGRIDRVFPDMDTLAGVDPDRLGMPRARARTVVQLASALADGAIVLDAGTDRRRVIDALEAIPGIGPWTASYIVMRALSDPDVLLPSDAAVRAGAVRLGLPEAGSGLAEHARRWAPWRSYATHHLWSAPDPARTCGRPVAPVEDRSSR